MLWPLLTSRFLYRLMGGCDVSHSVVPVGMRDLLGLLEVFSSSLSPSTLISFVPPRISPSCSSSSVYVWDTSCVEPFGVSPMWTLPVAFGRISGSLGLGWGLKVLWIRGNPWYHHEYCSSLLSDGIVSYGTVPYCMPILRSNVILSLSSPFK